MDRSLSILYRGPLKSCNYSCTYCPFALKYESLEELASDQQSLTQFVEWVKQQTSRSISIFFTPYGEAMIRRWYQQAIIDLTHFAHIRRVAIQTNLSAPLGWLKTDYRDKIGLWCTFHPNQTTIDSFLAQCARLDEMSIAYTVGVVGMREHVNVIKTLRSRLPSHVYLWINAYKRQADYYSPEERRALTEIDPHFETNNRYHHTLDKRCQTGETVISIDGKGQIRRCHFVDEVLGNIKTDDLESILRPRNCPNQTCGCHIGYVHLDELNLNQVYGQHLLERIPVSYQVQELRILDNVR